MFDFIKNSRNRIVKIKVEDKIIKVKLESSDVMILPIINKKYNWNSVIYH